MPTTPEFIHSVPLLPVPRNPVSAHWTYGPGLGHTTPAQAMHGPAGLYVVCRSEDGFTETCGRALDVKWADGGIEVLTRSGDTARWIRLGNVVLEEHSSIRVDYLLVESDEPVNA